MKGQVIGRTMQHGHAGSYARQPDMIVDSEPLGGDRDVPFGSPVVRGENGAAMAWAEDSTAEKFWGIAVREVKSALDFMNQNVGVYCLGEAIPVMKRGCVNVICQAGTPAPGGAVYIRTKADGAKPGAVVGGFEAAADAGNNAALTNVQWKGTADANGVAELRILTILNA